MIAGKPGTGYLLGLGILAPDLRAWFSAAATACFCGRPEAIISLMLALTTAWLLPFFSGDIRILLLREPTEGRHSPSRELRQRAPRRLLDVLVRLRLADPAVERVDVLLPAPTGAQVLPRVDLRERPQRPRLLH